MESFEKGLYEYFENECPRIKERLESGAKMDPAFEAEVRGALKAYAEVS
jgi:hypothetical protein